MPEIVEVEVIALNLRRWLQGCKIVHQEVIRETTIRRPGSSALAEALVGQGGLKIHRRGKVLLLEQGGSWGGLIRFGMTGKIVLESPSSSRSGARVRWHLEGTLPRRNRVGPGGVSLAFLDARNLGSITPVPLVNGESVQAILKEAVPGVDALSEKLDPSTLAPQFFRTRRPIRVVLLDQSIIAGLGNILVTEILFEAAIYPGKPACSLSFKSIEKLCHIIPKVIADTLEKELTDEIIYVGEAGAVNPFTIYGRGGEACPVCGAALHKEKLGGRTSVYCGICQRSGN